MNNGKIKISNYKDLIFIDLYSQEKITKEDIRWLFDSLKQKFQRKQNVIALISGSYNICTSATEMLALKSDFIGDSIAFVVQSDEMKVNDLYYTQFSYLKGKSVAYFNQLSTAYDWVKQNSAQTA